MYDQGDNSGKTAPREKAVWMHVGGHNASYVRLCERSVSVFLHSDVVIPPTGVGVRSER